MKQENPISKSFKCFFCSESHFIPKKGFPIDKLIEKLLKVKYGDKHEKAKSTFENLKNEMNNLFKRDDKTFMYDYLATI